MRLSEENIWAAAFKRSRHQATARFLDGRVLDVGCGQNELIRNYSGSGIGVDVFPWRGADLLCDTESLPFSDETFDTVTMVASLNHIVDRRSVLAEANRVLKRDGRLLVTMIDPIVGVAAHCLGGRHEESKIRGKSKGERSGLWRREVVALLKESGYSLERIVRFGLLKLNALYISRKIRATG